MPAGATAAATIGSAALKVGAAGQATKAAENAKNANLAYAKGIYNDASTNLNPAIHGGIASGNLLQGLLGTGGDPAASQRAFDTFRNSTNYNFRLDQGQKSVDTANAPQFHSGATAKALLNYGQGMAGDALQGYEGMLQGQQTLGAQSALGLGNIGTNISQQVSSANNNYAGVQGSAGIYAANAEGSALSGLTSLLNGGATASSFGSPSGIGTSSQGMSALGDIGQRGAQTFAGLG